MTQEKADKVFNGSSLGNQLEEFWSTEDDNVFIRYSEAFKYSEENGLDPNVIEWWGREEYTYDESEEDI